MLSPTPLCRRFLVSQELHPWRLLVHVLAQRTSAAHVWVLLCLRLILFCRARVCIGGYLVQVNNDVMCLGFVDGGINPRTSIVIGGHQIEDNFLQFDLAASRLGFSSSLLFRQTTCGNFNFTTST